MALSQTQRTARYQKKSCYRIALKFYKNTDKEVIAKLQSVDNRTNYVRQLIKADIEKK